MELHKINKLLSILPEGENKERIREKLNKLRRKQSGGQGLHDEFSMKPSGHIQIETIDNDGNVVGVLADQPNLVVDGAEEILLRAFSGDPSRTLYKNRVLKSNASSVYHIEAEEIIVVEGNKNVASLHPNEFWKEVNDDEFDIEYSYYPNTLYLEEVESVVQGKKAFRLVPNSSANNAPLSAEIYSSFTNLFIGLGDGLNYHVPFNDKRLDLVGTFEGDDVKTTKNINDHIEFTEKISNFEVIYEVRKDGGQIDVFVDDILQDTIDTNDASLKDGEVVIKSRLFDELDHTQEHHVKIVFSDALETISEPVMSIAGIKFDAFHKQMNGLIHEFENYTTEFLTPTSYNTTSTAPYTITLDHAPVKKGSTTVLYNNVEFQEIDKLEDLEEGKFFLDELHGVIHFSRALTNVMITFETTGEIIQKEKATNPTITTKNVLPQVKDERPEGSIDGSNRTFVLKFKPVTSIAVKVNGNTVSQGSGSANYSMNLNSGTITFNNAPKSGDLISVDYTYRKTVNVLKTEYEIDKSKELKMFDQNMNPMIQVHDIDSLSEAGAFIIDSTDLENKTILFDQETTKNETLQSVEFFYSSHELPGVPTNYSRQIVLKPKEVNDYPWYALDKGSIQFVAEFQEDVPNSSVTIREMGLFDGPRMDDNVKGFTGYPVRAFSLVRVGESRKDTATGIRVTWTITLTNENGEPFKGGL